MYVQNSVRGNSVIETSTDRARAMQHLVRSSITSRCSTRRDLHSILRSRFTTCEGHVHLVHINTTPTLTLRTNTTSSTGCRPSKAWPLLHDIIRFSISTMRTMMHRSIETCWNLLVLEARKGFSMHRRYLYLVQRSNQARQTLGWMHAAMANKIHMYYSPSSNADPAHHSSLKFISPGYGQLDDRK